MGLAHLDAAVRFDSFFPCIDSHPDYAPDEDFQIIKHYQKIGLGGRVYNCYLVSRIQYCKDGKLVGDPGYSTKPIEACIPIEIS
jgi:hypothetical protein